MSECQHCKGLEVQLTEVRTIVTRMDQELLGGPGKPGRLKEHEERLDKLEAWRNKILGALGVLGALVSWALGIRA